MRAAGPDGCAVITRTWGKSLGTRCPSCRPRGQRVGHCSAARTGSANTEVVEAVRAVFDNAVAVAVAVDGFVAVSSKLEFELPAVAGPLFQDQLRDPAPSRIGWAKLLARVFRIDVSVCPACQGPMRVVEAVTDPNRIAALLHGARAPPRPSPPGQLVLFGA